MTDALSTHGSRSSTGFAGLSFIRRQWKWLVADGVIGVVAGVFALVYPSITVLALGLLVGIGLLFQGVAEVAAGFAAVPGTSGRVTMVIWGVIVLVAGLICIAQPGAGVFAIATGTIAVLAGLAFLFRGLLALYLGWRLRSLPA
jgi:uncharacterized membrane protein HdeD (DUF308 family)